MSWLWAEVEGIFIHLNLSFHINNGSNDDHFANVLKQKLKSHIYKSMLYDTSKQDASFVNSK